MVDVRSDAERAWVGFIPGAVPLAWQQWPGMVTNAHVDDDLVAAVPGGGKVLFCAAAVRARLRRPSVAARAAGAFTVCPGGRTEMAGASLVIIAA